MFAYCGNNPVSRQDSAGNLWHVVFGAVIGGILNGAAKLAECISNKESVGKSIAQVLVSSACGAVGGALAATGIGVVGQGLIGAGLAAVESCSNQMISSGKIDQEKLLGDTLSGAFGGVMGGNGAAHGSKFMSYQRKQFVKNIGLRGFDEALVHFGKQTWNWSKKNLLMPTLQGIGKAFAAGRIFSPIKDECVNIYKNVKDYFTT